jgi:hypothetical protein
MSNAEVFISYAHFDKERVLEIYDELKALGIDCWLDKNKIPGGSRWSQEIVRGIQNCGVFLLMVSADSLKSENVSKELHLAAHNKKTILPIWLRLGLTYPDNLAYHLAETQYIAASDEFATWKESLLEALKLAGVTVPNAADRVATRPALNQVTTPILPYLANRLEQERHLFTELERHLQQQPHRPIAFIVRGDRESQCIDGFIDRLSKYSLPRHLARLGLSDQLEWKYIVWPQPVASAQASAAQERAFNYSFDISAALDLPLSAKIEAVARQIANLRKPVTFCSTIYGTRWQPEEPGLIRKVLEFWSRLPSLLNVQPLIVFLVVALEKPVETWWSRWTAPRPANAGLALRTLLQDSGGVDLDIVMLPELTDVSVPDVEHWVREIVRPADPEGMIRQIKQTFKQRGIAADHVSMEILQQLLQAVLPTSQRLRGA